MYGKPRPRAWRSFTNPLKLYQWTEPLKDFQLLYKYLDATVPLCLLAYVAKAGLEMRLLPLQSELKTLLQIVVSPFRVSGRWIATKKSKRDHVASQLLGDGVLFPPASAAEDVDTDEEGDVLLHPDDDELALVDSGQAEAVAEPMTEPPTRQIQVVDQADPLGIGASEEDLVYARTHLNPETGPDSYTYKRTAAGCVKRRRHCPTSTFTFHHKKIVSENSQLPEPKMFRRCTFCGSSTHSKRDKEGQPACKSFRSQLQLAAFNQAIPDLCTYTRCKAGRKSHTTSACPTLLCRCYSCHLRGHSSGDCPGNNAQALEEFKAAFESFADQNALLKRRFVEPSWGFYEPKQKIDYAAMISLPVADALKLC